MSGLGVRAKLGMAILMAVLLAAGCSTLPASNGVVVVPPYETKPTTQVLTPVYVNYLVVNPLPIVVEDTRAQGILHDNVVEFISGLRDVEVEKRINDNLSALYDEMRERDVAPYRGISLLVTPESTLARIFLRTSVTYNYNNVLSIKVMNDRAYVTKEGLYGSRVTNVNTIETRNFDLTTGEEISLKDVLADDVKYLELLNDLVSQHVLRSMPTDELLTHLPLLVSSFTGLKEDQVFYLSWQGIELVFDYRTPEFDTGCGYFTTSLPFQQLQGMVAVNQRYYSKNTNIFLCEDPPLMELITHPYQAPHVGESTQELYDNVYAQASYSYPVALPEDVASLVLRKYEEHQERVDELRLLPESEWLVTHHVRSTAQAGPFTSVTVDQSVYQSTEPFVDYKDPFRWMYGREGLVGSTYASYCFDGNGEERSLASLFVPGFDYKDAIENSFAEKVKAYSHHKNIPPFEELWEDIQFSLDTKWLTFYTRPVVQDGHASPIIFTVSFKELGCLNMTIFEP